jgi:multiple sugar transport system ATP-binding protein
MDEPLSNLDAKLRVEMRAYVAMLHRDLRTTTLYVTHDQVEAMTMGDRVAVMRDGKIEQCDIPQRLYDRPVNTFVASFVGSPAMNLVPSRLVSEGGSVYASLGAARVRLPWPQLGRRLGDYVGRDVVLGIRPEDIEDAAFVPDANGSAFDVQVALAETMGAEIVAHLDGGLVARLSPRSRAETGHPLRVAVDTERLHFFDPETEAAIG